MNQLQADSCRVINIVIGFSAYAVNLHFTIINKQFT